jgi:hypothetical protein
MAWKCATCGTAVEILEDSTKCRCNPDVYEEEWEWDGNLPKVISPEQERACLMTNPYEGDFGDGEVLLKDKMGNARKPHICTQCQEGIKPGDRVRMRTEAYEGKVMTFYFCTACCLAFAVSHLDEGRAWESRINLGRSTETPQA